MKSETPRDPFRGRSRGPERRSLTELDLHVCRAVEARPTLSEAQGLRPTDTARPTTGPPPAGSAGRRP